MHRRKKSPLLPGSLNQAPGRVGWAGMGEMGPRSHQEAADLAEQAREMNCGLRCEARWLWELR